MMTVNDGYRDTDGMGDRGCVTEDVRLLNDMMVMMTTDGVWQCCCDDVHGR